MIVVKVGGSLFDHPKLGPGLRAYLEALGSEVLLVPGGGPVADSVRELDRVHGLGEEAAHWLALRALSITGALLESLIAKPNPPSPFPEGKGVNSGQASCALADVTEATRAVTPLPFREGGLGGLGLPLRVLDCFAFAREDEAHPDKLPHTWSVTTDSIAARAAVVFRAERLVLLKSVDIPPGTPWPVAAANGCVDAHFPQIAQTLNCPVDALNFRRKLDARA